MTTPFQKFLDAVNQRPGDPTFSILKAHVAFKDLRRQYLDRTLTNPEALDGARLMFAQRLDLVQALQPVQKDDWTWEAVSKLNRLRNQLPHHPTPYQLHENIKECIEFWQSKSGAPTPVPGGNASTAEPIDRRCSRSKW